jgi:hypothetical protein
MNSLILSQMSNFNNLVTNNLASQENFLFVIYEF